MSKKFSEIVLQESHKGYKKGEFFHVPVRFFGKDGTRLYKIHGFFEDEGKIWAMASRLNKKTLKIPGNAPLCEGFDFEKTFGVKENSPSS